MAPGTGADDDPTRVTAYLDSLGAQTRGRVDQIRAAVHAGTPGLGERISYGVLTFTVGGRRAFHVGGFDRHVSVYPIPDDEALRERVAPHAAGKGTLRFPHTQPLPLELVEDVALWFVAAARER